MYISDHCKDQKSVWKVSFNVLQKWRTIQLQEGNKDEGVHNLDNPETFLSRVLSKNNDLDDLVDDFVNEIQGSVAQELLQY